MAIDSDSARFSRTLQSAILWPVGIILLTALLLLLFTFELFQVVKLSEHSYRVLTQTRQCENLILSTQNDVRGYLLTGDPDFVKVPNDARPQSESTGEFGRLKAWSRDNREQVNREEYLRSCEKHVV